MELSECIDKASQLYKEWIWEKGVAQSISVEVQGGCDCEVVITPAFGKGLQNYFTFSETGDAEYDMISNNAEWDRMIRYLTNNEF